jgi:tryptophan-rich sensory protein
MAVNAVRIPNASVRPSLWLLVLLVVLCLSVGWAGSVVTSAAIPTWYQTLERPAWTPPNWVFAPVWTSLYVFIGIAGWRVASASSPGHAAWGLWWMQLVLNAIWTPLFFGAHAVLSAAIVIVLLWLVIVQFIRQTWNTDRVAAWLFTPYLVWITYAASLNIGIWILN